MKVLILVAVLAVAQCAEVDVEKCSWGESYWCSGLKVAQQCGAFQHCMTTVWKNQEPSSVVDDSDVCQFCESVVDDVRKFLEDQKNQERIKNYLDSACAIIPDAGMADECKDMVDNYLDVVLELIASELDPKTVCSLMGLCNNAAFKDTAKHPAPAPRTPIQKPNVELEPICTDCKKFFQDMKDLMTDPKTEKELEQYIEDNLCTMLGSLQDYCNQMVEAYIPEILDLVMAEFDPADMCAAMGFCDADSKANTLLHRMRLQKSPLYTSARNMKSNDDICPLCKMAITELQTLDKDTKFQAEIENFLKNNLCSRLGSMKDVCEETVDQYLPDLFELIASELDPDTICQALGFCDADVTHTLRQSMPKKPAQKQKSVGASAQCVLCEFIMKELDEQLSKNATKQEIMDALNEVCNLLPDTIKQECVDFVQEYAPAIIAILEQEMDPQVVCTFLGLCKSSQHGPLMATPKVGDGEMCGTCETLVQYLDSLLEENSTMQAIEKLLEKICNFLPENIREECDDIIETYGPAILQLIAQFADPREVCTALGLCSAEKAHAIPMAKIVPSKPHLLGAKECTWGPSYWCDSMENAVKCQAVEHCKNHIWKN